MSRILVIDDEKNVRKMVRLTLERAGHTVEVAEDGGQGLELFGDGTEWDLVLTDQRMPGLQGRELTYEVQRRDPMARLVMMTSFATIELASDVLRAGATDFLRKPFSADVLRGAIEAALARPRLSLPVGLDEESSIVTTGALAGLPKRPVRMPSVSFYFNGYTFWPVTASQEEAALAQSLEIYRTFQIRGPGAASGRCILGMTPHVVQLVLAAINRSNMNMDFLWEMLCRESLTDYFWYKAEMPPLLLPVFELTDTQMEDIRRLAETNDDD